MALSNNPCDNELQSLGHSPPKMTRSVPIPHKRKPMHPSVSGEQKIAPLENRNEGICRYYIQKIFGTNKLRMQTADSQAPLPGLPYRKLCSLEGEMDIEEYARREWQTQKPNAIRMKEGYSRVKERGFPHIRRVRGDNYCALRSVLFQLLTFCDVTHTVLALYPTAESAKNRLDQLEREHAACLRQWSFGQNQILSANTSHLQALRGCVEAFYQTVDKLKAVPAGPARRELLAQELNRERGQLFQTDARLVEFVKLLMFSQAADLYRRQGAGEDVPLWFLLFSLRDNSASLGEFFQYHLNLVGDSLGLEQIEMFLLGRALNLRIRAFRLKSLGEDDFETLYPPLEDTFLPQEAPIVPLSAEDDRHYNVVY